MARQYTKVQNLKEIIFKLKAEGKTNREIGTQYGLTTKQVKELILRERRKERLIEAGYVLRPKGRPRKTAESEQERLNNKLIKQEMEIQLLRNFLSELGRR